MATVSSTSSSTASPWRSGVIQACVNLKAAGREVTVEEVVADKGYHAAETLELNEHLGLRTYIPEPQRQHERRWTDKPAEFQQAVYNNRRRMRRAKGRKFQRRRSEVCERTFAHICDSGGRAANLAAGTGERDHTLLDRRRRAQSRSHPPQAVRHRQAEEPPGRIRPCPDYAACHDRRSDHTHHT